jgi:iron complex transport system substrate-binding protein
MRRAGKNVSSLVLATLAVACARPDEPRRADSIERVVSLVPSMTEAIVALGERSRLVARTDYDLGRDLASLPSVGGATDPSLERILALQPDLVLVWQDSGLPPVKARLEAMGLRTEPVASSSLGDFRRSLARLGELLGVPERAARLIRTIHDSLGAVGAWVAQRPPVRVFYMVWPNPLITTGSGTYVDTLITLAGGVNIFADAPTAWPTVTFEALLRRDPDVIVWPRRLDERDTAAQALRTRPGWRRLRAIRRGRLVSVDVDLFNRPGPRLALAARALARALHEDRP